MTKISGMVITILKDQFSDIKKFWDDQAKKNTGSSLATSPDTIAYEMELDQMKQMIPTGNRVLDVGCGNGIKGIELAKELDIDYFGMDYSEEMISQANRLSARHTGLLKGKVQFYVGDILDKDSIQYNQFDMVISDRCLINLKAIENQILAIRHIHSMLKHKGIYLMFENSEQSLENLNLVRRNFALPDIKVRWHNVYIDEHRLFPAVRDHFTLSKTVSFASTYYLISRTLNALIIPQGEEINYMSEINKLSARLPALGDFSPLKLFVLEKV